MKDASTIQHRPEDGIFYSPELRDPSDPIPDSVRQYILDIPDHCVAIFKGMPLPDPSRWL